MMFWDIIAMLFAGCLFAGLVMPLRLFYKKTPKWIVPAMAGLGMISFQVLSEYTWYPTTKSNLPEGSMVVATVLKSTWFRPWSYIKPNVFQFVVLDANGVTATQTSGVYEGTLYFFERRMRAQALKTLFDCNTRKHAHVLSADQALQWQTAAFTEASLMAICDK